MTLLDLLYKLDEKENIQISFSTIKNCEQLKKESPMINIFDMNVKSIKTEGCSTLFVGLG